MDELIVEKEGAAQEKEKKAPKLSLPSLIRSINVDSYTEKVLNHKTVNSKELFSKFVFLRMKKVRIDKLRKAIGEMTLEQDDVRFIYLPFVDAVNKNEKGIIRCYVKTQGPDGKAWRKTTWRIKKNRWILRYYHTKRLAGCVILKCVVVVRYVRTYILVFAGFT